MSSTCLFQLLCLGLALLIISIDSFRLIKPKLNKNLDILTTCNHKLYAATNSISPRKSLFFKIVEAGLRDKYSEDEISRILKFCQYSKLEIPLPILENKLHEPCEEYIDGLTAQPWWDKQQFEWSQSLEKISPDIMAELGQFESDQIFKSDSRYTQTMGEGWTAFRLQRFGAWITENCELFPKTTQLLQSLSIPLAIRGVMFAKQKPYSGVGSHSDGRNFILTAHLGLQIPHKTEQASSKCWIKVGGIQKPWIQDQVIIFDTSFVHETMNDTDEDRYVMIIDFWHPDLTQIERDSLQYIYDARNKFDGDKMNEIESSFFATVAAEEKEQQQQQGLVGMFQNMFKSKS